MPYHEGMKLFAFLVAFLSFAGGLALFGYSFAFPPEWQAIGFAGGIIAISIAIAIPAHLLPKLN